MRAEQNQLLPLALSLGNHVSHCNRLSCWQLRDKVVISRSPACLAQAHPDQLARELRTARARWARADLDLVHEVT